MKVEKREEQKMEKRFNNHSQRPDKQQGTEREMKNVTHTCFYLAVDTFDSFSQTQTQICMR